MDSIYRSEKNANKSSTQSKTLRSREKAFAFALLFLILLGTGIASLNLSRLRTQYSMKQFLPKSHPLLQADLEARSHFFLDESQPALITLTLPEGKEGGDWFKMKRLQDLERLTHELATIEGVQKTLSLATVQGATQSSDELSVGTILRFKSEKERRQKVLADPMLSPLIVSQDGRTTLVLVSLAEDIKTDRLASAIGAIESKLKEGLPYAKVEVGGVPAVQWQLTDLVNKELGLFMVLAVVASCFALLIVFSSFWSIIIPFVAILVANIFVVAFMAIAGYPMTVLAVTIPILAAVMVLALCIHTLLRLVEESHRTELSEGSEKAWLSAKANLVYRTVQPLFMPNLLTALTTGLGFATLMTESVPVIREFGITVFAAVMISWAATTLLLIPLILLLPVPRARAIMLREAEWAEFIFRHSRVLTIAIVVVCTALALLGQNLQWTARLFDDLPEKQTARVTTERIDRDLGGVIPLEVIVRIPAQAEPWNDPSAIARLDLLLKQWRLRPEVGSAFGLPELLRQATGGAGSRLPASRSNVAESWFLLSMSDENPLKSYLSADGSTTRISVRLRDVASDRSLQVREEILNETRKLFPTAEVTGAGMASTVHTLNNELSRSLIYSFWDALLVISVVLLIMLRSWRWTLIATLPNLVPTAVLVGILAICQTPIKPGVALVFSIVLGIAFNNTVYMVQRLRNLIEETGCSPRIEVIRMLRIEGNPGLVSSLTLLAGFGIFLLSQFEINRVFGGYMLLSLLFGLIGDLVLMPALIHWWPSLLVPNEKPAIVLNANDMNDLSDFSISSSSIEEEEMKENNGAMKNGKVLSQVAACFAVFVTTFTSPLVSAASDADLILKSMQDKIASKDEAAQIKMKVVESNGSSKERELVIKRKSGARQQVLVRLLAPSDVSGVALLSVAKGKSEDQWLYMPSQKKARRVVSGSKSQRFLDTEFSLEDFSASTYARFENKVIKEQRTPAASMVVIQSTVKPGETENSYSKILTWVDKNTYQVQKSEYYDHGGKLMKTMVFRDYKKYGSVWRAQTVEVMNVQNKRSTVLKIAGLKLNSGLSDSEFTQGALEDE